MANLKQLYDPSMFSKKVSVTESSKSYVMTLQDLDSGNLTLFPLAPGIVLSFNSIFTSSWPAAVQAVPSRILLLNYCLDGRCEVNLENGRYAYVSSGQISFGTQQAQNEYRYPISRYKGIELFCDLDILQETPYGLFQELLIDLTQLCQTFHLEEDLLLFQSPEELLPVFSELWMLRNTQDISSMKLLIAKLLLVLSRQNYLKNTCIPYFSFSQVTIAKETQAIFCSDLSKTHTARELAARFQISETSLKSYFHGVYGENLSVYIRKKRMYQAAKLLTTTKWKVADIADQVGYENQSKFASAFKRQFHMAPLEYRRLQGLSHSND